MPGPAALRARVVPSKAQVSFCPSPALHPTEAPYALRMTSRVSTTTWKVLCGLVQSVCLTDFIFSYQHTAPLQPHYPPCCSLNCQTLLPQGLCTGRSLCQEWSPQISTWVPTSPLSDGERIGFQDNLGMFLLTPIPMGAWCEVVVLKASDQDFHTFKKIQPTPIAGELQISKFSLHASSVICDPEKS